MGAGEDAAGEDAVTIGRRLRQARCARGKTLVVVAGLAGISESHLSRLERGQRALNRRSLIEALANALEIAPSELTTRPVRAPGNEGPLTPPSRPGAAR